jgi:NAD(P)-dependent dehydrogenase (short-subunit alcohol dehydrogenase family)
MDRFTGKTALVSGAGGGIGRAVALRLAGEGAAVMCVDRDAGAAARTVAGLERAAALECDVTDPASCGAAIAETLRRFDAIDVLVNAAGVAASHAIEEFPVADWRRIIDVNLTGTFLLSQAAIGALLGSKGTIVNLASVAGIRATPYNAAYCASKGGVVMLTKSMAIELAKRDVRVNAVCPSAVDTALLRGFTLPDGADMQLLARAASPMGRVLEVEEISAAVAFLASSEARSITGSILTVDGGATA